MKAEHLRKIHEMEAEHQGIVDAQEDEMQAVARMYTELNWLVERIHGYTGEHLRKIHEMEAEHQDDEMQAVARMYTELNWLVQRIHENTA